VLISAVYAFITVADIAVINLIENNYPAFLSRLTPYAGEITGHHQCGFQRTGVSYRSHIPRSADTGERTV
jgi:hypothetical protein